MKTETAGQGSMELPRTSPTGAPVFISRHGPSEEEET